MSDWMKTLKVGDKVATDNNKGIPRRKPPYHLHEVTRVSNRNVWILFFGTETSVDIATQRISRTHSHVYPVTEEVLADIAHYDLVRLVEGVISNIKWEDVADEELRFILKVMVDAEVRRLATCADGES